VTLADIAGFATGDIEQGRIYAEERLGARRAAGRSPDREGWPRER